MMKALQSSPGKLYSIGKSENIVELLFNSKYFDFLGRNQLHFMNHHQTHDHFGFISLQCKHKMMILPVMSSLSADFQAEIESADQSKTVHVKLQLQKECIFGEQILVVGDDPIFGMWDPVNAVPLEWSEDHLWHVELDIPVGRTIHFKFLLIGNSGDIVWQPDPNRAMSTWETSNVVTVLDHWENAEVQKITEEEPNQINGSEIPIINETLSMVAENITSNVVTVLDHWENAEFQKITEEEPNQINGSEIPIINETLSMVAENITSNVVTVLDHWENAEFQKITEEEPIQINSSEIPIINETMSMVAENITYPKEKHGKADDVSDLESSQNEENIVEHEVSPVLVPDLSPLNQDGRSIIMNITVGTDEAENTKVSKASEEQQVTQTKLQHTSESGDVQQNPALAKVKEQWQINMDWGRTTLQKVLLNLGFDTQKE